MTKKKILFKKPLIFLFFLLISQIYADNNMDSKNPPNNSLKKPSNSPLNSIKKK